jgi:hypothetical protein
MFFNNDNSSTDVSQSSSSSNRILLPTSLPDNDNNNNNNNNNNITFSDDNTSFSSMNQVLKATREYDIAIKSLPTSTFGLDSSSLKSIIEFNDSQGIDLKRMITDNIYLIGDMDLKNLFPRLYQSLDEKDSDSTTIISSRKDTSILSNFGIVISFTNYQFNSKFKWRMEKNTINQPTSSSSSSSSSSSTSRSVSNVSSTPLRNILEQYNFAFVNAAELDRISSTGRWKITSASASSSDRSLNNYSPSRIFLTVTTTNRTSGIRNNNLYFLHISDFGRIAEQLSIQASKFFTENSQASALPEEGLYFDYQLSSPKSTPSIARFRLLPFSTITSKQYYESNVLFQLEYVLTAMTKSYSSVVIPNSTSTYTN